MLGVDGIRASRDGGRESVVERAFAGASDDFRGREHGLRVVSCRAARVAIRKRALQLEERLAFARPAKAHESLEAGWVHAQSCVIHAWVSSKSVRSPLAWRRNPRSASILPTASSVVGSVPLLYSPTWMRN